MSRSILKQLLQNQFHSKELRSRIEGIYLSLQKKSGNKTINEEAQRIQAVIAAFYAILELRKDEKEMKQSFQKVRKQDSYGLITQEGQKINQLSMSQRGQGEDFNEINSSKNQNESSKLFQSSEGSVEEEEKEEIERASNGKQENMFIIKNKHEQIEIEREGEGYLENQSKNDNKFSLKSKFLMTEKDKNLISKMDLGQLKQAFCPEISMDRILQKMKETEGQGDCLRKIQFSSKIHKKTTEINQNYQLFQKLLQIQDELLKSSKSNQNPSPMEPTKNCASLIWKVFLLMKQQVNLHDSSDLKKLIFLFIFICERMFLKNSSKNAEIMDQVKDDTSNEGQHIRSIVKGKLKELLAEGKFDMQKMKDVYSGEFRKIFKKIEKKINRKIEPTLEEYENKEGIQSKKQSEVANQDRQLRLFFDGNNQNLKEIENSVNKILQERDIFEECNFLSEIEGIGMQKKLVSSKKQKAIQQQRWQAEISLTDVREDVNKIQLEGEISSSELFDYDQTTKNNTKEIFFKKKQNSKDNTKNLTKLLGEQIDKKRNKNITNLGEKQNKSCIDNSTNVQGDKNRNSYPDIVILQASEKELIINRNNNQAETSNQLLSPNYMTNKHGNPQMKIPNPSLDSPQKLNLPQQSLEQQQKYLLKPKLEQAIQLSSNKSGTSSNTFSSSSHALDKLKWLNLNSKSEPTTRINEIMLKLGNTYNMNSINNVTSSTDNSFQIMIASKMAQTSRDIFYLNKKCTDQSTFTPDEIEGLVNKTVCLFQNFLERMINDEQQKLSQLVIVQKVEQKGQQQQQQQGTPLPSPGASDLQSSEELILNLFVNKTFLFALLCVCIMTMCFAKDITRISLRFILQYCSITPLDYWRIISNFARLDKNMPFSVQEYLFQQEKQILLYEIWDYPTLVENILTNIKETVRKISPVNEQIEEEKEEQALVESNITIENNPEKIDIENTLSAEVPSVGTKISSTTTSNASPMASTSNHLYEILCRRLICHCAMRTYDMGQLLELTETAMEFIWQALMEVLLNKQVLLAHRYIDNILILCIYSFKIPPPSRYQTGSDQLKIRDLIIAFSPLPFFSLNPVGWQQQQLQQLQYQSQNNNSQNSQSNWQVLAENIQINSKYNRYSNPNDLVNFYNRFFLNRMKSYFKSLRAKTLNMNDLQGEETTEAEVHREQMLQENTTQQQYQQSQSKNYNQKSFDETTSNNKDNMISETQFVQNNLNTNNNNINPLPSVDCTYQTQPQSTSRLDLSNDDNNDKLPCIEVIPQPIAYKKDQINVPPLIYSLPISFTAFSFVKSNKKAIHRLYCK